MATEYKKIITRKGTQAEFTTLQGSTAPLLEGELGFITDENELVIGTSAGNSLSINKRFGTTAGIPAEGNHTHAFADLTSKPTTLSGYGITDTYTGTVIDTKIATNTTNISTNVSNIATNASNITTNSGLISLNLAAIQSNDTDIAANATGISNNASSIATNATDIATNTSNITLNGSGLSSLSQIVSTNTSNISTNTSNISTNTTAISGKQDTLVSGTNIKTVGGVSLLGAGDIPINPEWTFWWEVNEDNVSSVTLNSTNYPGLVYDTSNYDYKFVVNGYTSDTDSSGSMKIEINGDSTAGRYSMLRNRTGFTSSGPFNLVEGNTTTATNMDVGVVLGSGTQGTQTVLHSEFTLSRGLDFANPPTSQNSSADYHAFIVQGKASIVSVPGNGQGQTAENTIASYSQQSDFSGGYLKPVSQGGGGNITVVKLSDLPDAGNTDKVKVRIYRRER